MIIKKEKLKRKYIIYKSYLGCYINNLIKLNGINWISFNVYFMLVLLYMDDY